MTMDIHRYKGEVKREILRRISLLDSDWDPFDAAWLCYAISHDGVEGNQRFHSLVARLREWSEKPSARQEKRSLAPLCFLGCFERQRGKEYSLAAGVSEDIRRLTNDGGTKFSPANDPEQVFPAALFAKCSADEATINAVKSLAESKGKGTVRRRTLFAASLLELDEQLDLELSSQDVADPGDAVALLWWVERYGKEGDRATQWRSFETRKEELALSENVGDEDRRILSVPELALLYESVVRVSRAPDPQLLFALYPLHPRVRQIASSLFEKSEYKNAVEEATKALNEHIKKKTGSHKDEVDLVQSIMNPGKPVLTVASDLNTTSGKNEQDGIRLIGMGIFKAFRNPKAHQPKDAPGILTEAQEALEELVIISYMFKRIDRGVVEQRKGGAS